MEYYYYRVYYFVDSDIVHGDVDDGVAVGHFVVEMVYLDYYYCYYFHHLLLLHFDRVDLLKYNARIVLIINS
jgi:hypothetical protein